MLTTRSLLETLQRLLVHGSSSRARTGGTFTPQPMMQVIDLSHTIHAKMPVYPGTEQPLILTPYTVETAGFREKKLTLLSHTGTHLDAPAHLLADARTLDQLPIERFIGRACLIPLTGLPPCASIQRHDLEPYQERIRQSEFVLLQTGWSQYWGQERYFADYPVCTTEAAQWLVECDLKGIGLDMISADPCGALTLPIHKIFLARECLIIENLCNLHLLPATGFTFACFPLKLADADGSPVRAVALR